MQSHAPRPNVPAGSLILIFTLTFASMVVMTRAAEQRPGPEGLTAMELRCEMRNDPLGIQSTAPRLSWIIQSPARGERQVAYHVLAASSRDLLQPGRADLWDSGRRKSDESIHVEYAGKPLRSGQRVFWTVKVTGRDGRESPWATPAQWTMGLLAPGDWHAKWITDGRWRRDDQPAITRASWIWYPEEPVEGQPAVDAPLGTRHFRRAFELPAGVKLTSAFLHIGADNEAVIHLNGQRVGKQDEWQHPTRFDIGRLLRSPGENVLTIAATNGKGATGRRNPAGLVAALVVSVEDAKPIEFVTDKSWETSLAPAGDAQAKWQPAKVVAEWGAQPWNHADASGPHPPLPIFRRRFEIQKRVRRALVHVTGLGHYQLVINGKPVGDRLLDPAWSKYEKTVYYNTFDVTDLVARGGNVIGVMLGRSYYATRGDRRLHGGVNDNPPVLLAQLEIEHGDGSATRIVSDGSWRWTVGPWTHLSILGGPTYDARRLPDGWATAAFDDSAWKSAQVIDPKLGELASPASPPLRAFDVFKPVHVNEPESGKYVYDFGQNASATVRLNVKGPAGATLRLMYAEQRHGQSPHRNDGKGVVDQSGIRSPNYFEYTLRGDDRGETWFCDLFYSGFQYLQLEGAVPASSPNPQDKPVVTAIESIHVRADAPVVGTFGCSNAMYEKIDTMVSWAVRNNLSHVLTDCPHREKLGWLEVPHLMWDSMAYRFDLSGFGPKVCRDIADSQSADGMIPTVAPSYATFHDGFQYTPEWGAAGVLIPWYVYQWYGDRRNLEQSYPMMRRFVDYMHSTSTELVPKAGLGDWYDYGHGERPGPSKFTPPELSAMAIFHDCARRVADAANVIGKPDDERAYRDLAARIHGKFNARFYAGGGTYKNNGSCQTANSMALVCALVDESEQPAVADAIVKDLEKRDYQQTAGDVGFHYLVRALTDFGKSDALFRILNRDGLGSYAFLVNAGWTSLPEAWDADHNSSMNHCMLGHIQEWFNRDLAGIQPEAVAFKRFRLRPTAGPGVSAASATLQTPYGQLACAWKLADGAFTIAATVPANTTALVHVPATTREQVAEGGDAEGVKFVRLDGGRAIFEVGSGTYRFRARAN